METLEEINERLTSELISALQSLVKKAGDGMIDILNTYNVILKTFPEHEDQIDKIFNHMVEEMRMNYENIKEKRN